MSKETDIAISVTVKDGPKTQPQATKLPKDYCATNVIKAINEEVVISGDDCNKDHWVDLAVGDTPQGEVARELVFVAVHADRYKYKDACGKEQPGIRYAVSPEILKAEPMKAEFLDGPHVYVSRRLQPLTEVKKLYFQVCKELLSCVAEPDKKKVVINVTYGVGTPNGIDCPPCDPCPAQKGVGK